jgi:hypothetical protein
MKSYPITIAIFLAVFSLAAVRPVQLMRDPLEGKWDVTVTPDDDAHGNGGREFKDTVTFKNGTFSSPAMKKHGFDDADYEENTRPAGLGEFTVIQKSKTEGKIKWSGTIAATELTGDFVWTKADGTVLNYTLKGSRQ